MTRSVFLLRPVYSFTSELPAGEAQEGDYPFISKGALKVLKLDESIVSDETKIRKKIEHRRSIDLLKAGTQQ